MTEREITGEMLRRAIADFGPHSWLCSRCKMFTTNPRYCDACDALICELCKRFGYHKCRAPIGLEKPATYRSFGEMKADLLPTESHGMSPLEDGPGYDRGFLDLVELDDSPFPDDTDEEC